MPSEEIGCNGASLLVTANCKAALCQLRDSLQTIKLWIDSICIDQSSDAVEERNRQVALMGEIYKCAKRVIVWLGKSDIYIRRAFDLIIEIVSLTERYAEENGQQVRKRLYDKVKELSNSGSINFLLREDQQTHSPFRGKEQIRRTLQRPFSSFLVPSYVDGSRSHALLDGQDSHTMWRHTNGLGEAPYCLGCAQKRKVRVG